MTASMSTRTRSSTAATTLGSWRCARPRISSAPRSARACISAAAVSARRRSSAAAAARSASASVRAGQQVARAFDPRLPAPGRVGYGGGADPVALVLDIGEGGEHGRELGGQPDPPIHRNAGRSGRPGRADRAQPVQQVTCPQPHRYLLRVSLSVARQRPRRQSRATRWSGPLDPTIRRPRSPPPAASRPRTEAIRRTCRVFCLWRRRVGRGQLD